MVQILPMTSSIHPSISSSFGSARFGGRVSTCNSNTTRFNSLRFGSSVGPQSQCFGLKSCKIFRQERNINSAKTIVSMAQESTTVTQENALEWVKRDKRRLLHVVYRVGDLDRTIKFYTECLGMKLLRKRDIPEERYTNAFLGYGPEDSHFVIELTYNYGVDKYDIGTAFGHFGIAVDDIEKGLEEDPRIKVMRKEWFEGKNCLDIGCNSGLITITIAKKFGCQKILGIDIDSDRIEDARRNLRRIVRMSESKKRSKVDKLNGDEPDNIISDVEDKTVRVEISGDCSASYLFDRVSFCNENFIFGSSGDKVYDTILCLSVTKWIHLNWGDEGLIILFSKVWRLLKPDGVFILEPQPWKSYISNRQVSEVALNNYKNISIFPQDFQDILLDKIGFRKIENLSSSLNGSKTGFNRPILALWK